MLYKLKSLDILALFQTAYLIEFLSALQMVSQRAQRAKQNGLASGRVKTRSGGQQDAAMWWMPSNLLLSALDFTQSKTFRAWMKRNVGELALSTFILVFFAYLYIPSVFLSDLCTVESFVYLLISLLGVPSSLV